VLSARIRAERLLVIMKRELKVKASYRTTAVLSGISVIAGLFSYAFLGNTAVLSSTTQSYGMSLAAFLVSGVAFSSIITNGVGLFYQYATPTQIEEVLITPTGIREYALSSAFLTILSGVGTSALLFILSILVLGLDYSYNLPLLGMMIALGVASSIGLGFIGLGFQMVYKQTYFLSWLFYSFGGLIGNMIVPVQILPNILQTLSYLTPQYYFFTGIRVALGSNVASASWILTTFSVYTLILVALGLLVLDRSMKFVRHYGTLRWT
jgi:ABC-type multidrug transport system permease subunit